MSSQAKRRLHAAFNEMEKERENALPPEPRVPDEENDGEEFELSEAEVK